MFIGSASATVAIVQGATSTKEAFSLVEAWPLVECSDIHRRSCPERS